MFIDRRLGGVPRYFLNRPKDWRMRVPDQVGGCVVFVGRVIQAGSVERRAPSGTAFIIAMPVNKDTTFLYFVTAKHVADQLSLGPWFLRMNHKENDIADLLVNDPPKWFYHPKEPETTDVAVAILGHVPWEDLVFSTVPTTMFAGDEVIKQKDIGVGDLVFITGLFTRMTGEKKNIPIVRMGNIAMMPSERVPGIEITKGKPVEAEVYLIEARSVGGLSGSPVFVRETNFYQCDVQDKDEMRTVEMAAPGAFYLLGLAHGHWDVREEEINEVRWQVTQSDDRRGVNLGIAVVVPAQKILDILYSEEMNKSRQDHFNAEASKIGSTTPDMVRLPF